MGTPIPTDASDGRNSERANVASGQGRAQEPVGSRAECRNTRKRPTKNTPAFDSWYRRGDAITRRRVGSSKQQRLWNASSFKATCWNCIQNNRIVRRAKFDSLKVGLKQRHS